MTSGETGSSAEDEKKAKANIGTSDGTKDKQDEREEEVPMTFPQRVSLSRSITFTHYFSRRNTLMIAVSNIFLP